MLCDSGVNERDVGQSTFRYSEEQRGDWTWSVPAVAFPERLRGVAATAAPGENYPPAMGEPGGHYRIRGGTRPPLRRVAPPKSAAQEPPFALQHALGPPSYNLSAITRALERLPTRCSCFLRCSSRRWRW